MFYCILYKCPRPGYWEPVHHYLLQRAEWELQLNKRFYHERAKWLRTKLTYSSSNDLYVYRWDDCQRLIAAMQAIYPFAKFALLAAHGAGARNLN